MNNPPNQTQLGSPEAKALFNFNKPRITDDDCEILSSAFLNDDDLLLALRNLFFGFELSNSEWALLNRIKNPKMLASMDKMFYPTLQKDVPIGQNIDLWMTNDIQQAKTPEDFKTAWESKEILLEMIGKSLQRLKKDEKGGKGVDLIPKKNLEFMIARNAYIGYVSNVIRDIVMNAHRKKETVAEVMERLKKDSVR